MHEPVLKPFAKAMHEPVRERCTRAIDGTGGRQRWTQGMDGSDGRELLTEVLDAGTCTGRERWTQAVDARPGRERWTGAMDGGDGPSEKREQSTPSDCSRKPFFFSGLSLVVATMSPEPWLCLFIGSCALRGASSAALPCLCGLSKTIC